MVNHDFWNIKLPKADKNTDFKKGNRLSEWRKAVFIGLKSFETIKTNQRYIERNNYM